ncbi:hypothetical protein quinque_001704 [Culex quinquefasciatus]
MLNPNEYGLQYSSAHFRQYAMKELDISYRLQAGQIASDNHPVPTGAWLHWHENLGGLKRLSSYHYIVSNMDALFDLLDNKVMTVEEQKKEGVRSPAWSTGRIAKLLNIDPEDVEQVEGQLWLEIFNAPHLIAFDNNTIDELPRVIKKFMKDLEVNWSVNITKVYQQGLVTVAMPLETGFPFTFSTQSPTLVKLEVDASAETKPNMARKPAGHPENGNDEHIHIPLFANVTADRYIAGFQKKHHIHAPLRLEAQLDNAQNEYELNIQPLEPKKDILLAHISSWPYTAYKDITDIRPIAESPNAQILHDAVRRTKTVEGTIGQQLTGVALRYQAKYDKPALVFGDIVEHIQQHDLMSALLFPLHASQPCHYHQLNLWYDAQRSPARHQSEGYYNEKNLAQPFVFKAASQRRQEQFLKNAGAGIRNSLVSVWDLGAEFEGRQNKAEFVLTLAKASSPLSFGEKCAGGAQVSVSGKLRQTDLWRETLRSSAIVKKCKNQMAEGYFALPECQNATRLASALDHYTFDIEFKEIPSSVRNMTNKALNWVQSAVITRWEEDCVSHKGKGRKGSAQD